MLSTGEISFTLFYFLLCSAIILRFSFFKGFILSVKWIAAIFLFKILTGIVYGLIHYYYYQGGDTFAYFQDAQIVRKSLADDPFIFLKLLFGINTRPPDADIITYARAMSYWNDMGSYFIIRFHTLAGLITFNHYYANVVIYNFLTLIGILYLFRFICSFLPGKKYWIAAALFIFPAVVFWSSGIHKDGISLAAIGIILYFSSKLATGNFSITANKNNSSGWKESIFLLVGIWLLFVVRNYLLMLLAPCLVAFTWVCKFPKYGLLKFLSVFIIFYFILFNLKFINPSLDLLGEMSRQQLEFSQLHIGNTNTELPLLDSKFSNLLRIIPEALFNCLLHPFFWEISSPLQLSSAADNLLVLLLVVLTFFFLKEKHEKENALFLFSVFFAFSVFIFVGSIVPNIGALVRYKMPGVLFLVLACFSMVKIPGKEPVH